MSKFRARRPYVLRRSVTRESMLAKAIVSGALLIGCGSVSEWEEEAFDEDLGSLQEAITGGINVTSSSSFTETLRINTTASNCTAVKIGGTSTTTKLLTAAHCVTGTETSIRISNNNIPAVPGTSVPVAANGIRRHPSYVFGGETPGVSSRYDIATITLAQPTGAGTAPLTTILPPVALGATLTGVGYGCNGTDTAPRKRTATFTAAAPAGGNLAHSIFDVGSPTTCLGDSGGPLYDQNSKLVGITHGGTSSNSSWSRVGNVLDWINAPVDANDPSLLVPSPVGMNVYFAHTANSRGFCLSASSLGGPAELNECDGPNGAITSKFAGWTLFASPVGGPGYFRLHSRGGIGCLTVRQVNPTSDGEILEMRNCDGDQFSNLAKSQAFTFGPVHTAGFGRMIQNLRSGMCLTTPGGGSSLGTGIVQKPCPEDVEDLDPPGGSCPKCTTALGWMVTR